MGYNKLLLPFKGWTVIEETLQQLTDADVDHVFVVTGFEADRIKQQLAGYLDDRISIIHNPRYEWGRSESIKCALPAVGGDTAAALFIVADKPGVSADLLNRAITRFREDRPGILYIKTPTGRGHPIIFARRMFARLEQLTGDVMGNELIAENSDTVVEVPDDTIQIDIDTESDYQRLMCE